MQRIAFIVLLLALLGLGSCGEYLDINTSPNAPEKPGDLDLLLADMTSTTAYNLVGGGNWTRFGAQWIQHVANNSTPPSNDTYRINTSDMNNEWAFSSYAGVLINGKRVEDLGTTAEQWHHVGVAKVLMAHNFALLTDFWGEIPFAEALQREGNIKPDFQDQETVYQGIQAMLDEGIELLRRPSDLPVGNGDFFYGGDTLSWLRLAHALKARYHLRLAGAPGYDAASQAQAALSALAGAMQSPDDEARFPFNPDPGQEAPWNQWVNKFATSMQISQHMVQLLESLQDPRLPIMADQNQDGLYIGHQNGATPTNTLAERSAIGQYFLDPDLDVPLMTYVEQKFIEAEAEWILGNRTAAQAAYETAIRTHMQQLSGSGELQTVIGPAEIDAYLGAHPLSSLEDLIVQKYVAAFVLSSFEAYNDFRRTGFPSSLQPALNGDVNQIPTRMIYTDTEINNNAENVPQGITLTSRVWWDAE